MKKITVKANAKVNLTLDVFEKQNNFHPITSLVTSISVCDTVTVAKRNDHRISIKTLGIEVGCPKRKNNAYLAAELFMKTYSVCGVDITVNKMIPVGAGLGGSSADIAGVLKGMNALFGGDKDILTLASRLGSDSGYMLKGGVARLSGRGEIVERLNVKLKLHFLIIYDQTPISAKECYALFDKDSKRFSPCTDLAIDELKKGSADFYKSLKNDLYPSALKILPNLERKIKDLESAGAIKALMTGSGCAVYGLFEDGTAVNKAYKKLKPLYGDKIIKALSVD